MQFGYLSISLLKCAGSTEKQQQKLWVHDGEQLVLKDIEYVPGLYKIFDEILVNAADNKVRDPKMDKLEVNIDPGESLLHLHRHAVELCTIQSWICSVLVNAAVMKVRDSKVDNVKVLELASVTAACIVQSW